MRRILVLPSALLSDVAPVLVQRAAFEVRAADSIAQVFDLAASWMPEVLIFGDELPDGSPAELCAAVRGDRRLEGMRLCLLSSFLPGDDMAADVLLARVDAHLVLPVAEEPLLRTVGVLLDIKLRRPPTLPLELLARVDLEARIDTADRDMLANVLGLCETGLTLECQDRLKPGEVIRVTFTLPDTGSRIDARCMVLNADAVRLHYGCEFLDCGAEAKIAIRQYVREQLGPTEVTA